MKSPLRSLSVTLIALLLIAPRLAVGQSGQPSRIPEGEAHFTPEQLREYYLVYEDADVQHLRRVFDNYLKRGEAEDEEFRDLRRWSKEYYRSKFIVLSRDQNTFGGTLITIIFQDRPDKVFVAWVYREGNKGTPALRKFDLGELSNEDIRRIGIRYRAQLRDKAHAI